MTVRRLGLALIGLGLGISCRAADLPEDSSDSQSEQNPVLCGTGPTTTGSWTTLAQPSEVSADGLFPGVIISDGSRLWATAGQWLGTLEPGASEWSVSETEPTVQSLSLDKVANTAGDDWLFGYPTRGDGLTLVTLNLSSGVWSNHSIPKSIQEIAGLGQSWVDGELALPTGSFRASQGREELTLGLALFDPVLGTWRQVPTERIASYPVISSPIETSWPSCWIGTTLYTWGPLRDGSAVFMRSLDLKTEKWSTLPTANGPGVRLGGGMLADQRGHLFLYGGYGTSDASPPLRELWRFDLETQTWTQLHVPKWADTTLGAVIDDKLYFFGACTTGAVYDPAEDSWAQLPALSALADARGTQLRVAGGRLVISGIFYHPSYFTSDIFLFDPKASASSNLGGAGSN